MVFKWFGLAFLFLINFGRISFNLFLLTSLGAIQGLSASLKIQNRTVSLNILKGASITGLFLTISACFRGSGCVALKRWQLDSCLNVCPLNKKTNKDKYHQQPRNYDANSNLRFAQSRQYMYTKYKTYSHITRSEIDNHLYNTYNTCLSTVKHSVSIVDSQDGVFQW